MAWLITRQPFDGSVPNLCIGYDTSSGRGSISLARVRRDGIGIKSLVVERKHTRMNCGSLGKE
jgi:hypothetical protein